MTMTKLMSSLNKMHLHSIITAKDTKRAESLKAKIDRYESDPATGEGKKELVEKAKKLEAERADAKRRSPYYTFAGSALQISIVLLSAAILSVSMPLFWAACGVGAVGALLMSQAMWMWMF